MTSNDTTVVPVAAILSAWQAHDWQNGVALDRLHPLDRLTIRTRHSIYEVIVSSPSSGDVLVRGGEFFPEFTPARLAGSTLGGSFLKLRTINIGFRLEFSLGPNFVLTSPVQAIECGPDASVSG
ncbi:MAG TPA: hypothetical protein VFA59_08525 [Vicinamibacterales bacterium]|nr:hypothetical protein [Vicinamibacterales bacterium]